MTAVVRGARTYREHALLFYDAFRVVVLHVRVLGAQVAVVCAQPRRLLAQHGRSERHGGRLRRQPSCPRRLRLLHIREKNVFFLPQCVSLLRHSVGAYSKQISSVGEV
jgi:hypothetical protein